MLDSLLFSLVSLVFGLVFVAAGTLAALVMAVSFISIRLIDDYAHKRICYFFADIFWSVFPMFCLKWGGLELSIYGEPQVLLDWNVGHNIIVENHSYEIDFIIGYCVLFLADIVGSSKLVGKKMLSYLPVQGPVWFFTDSLFVKRNWKEDENIIKEHAQKFEKYPKNIPITLLLHPEGTRFTQKKYNECLTYYKERGLEPLRNLLTPRMRGFKAVVSSLRDNFHHVIDSTLLIRSASGSFRPTVRNLLLRRKFVAEMHVKVYNMNDVPADQEDLEKWLMTSYRFKDNLIDSFHEKGTIARDYNFLTSSMLPNDLNYRCLLLLFITTCFYGTFVMFFSNLTGMTTTSLIGWIFGGLYILSTAAIQFLTVPS